MAAVFGLIITGALALLILWGEGVADEPKNMLTCAGLIALCMLLRGLVMNYETLDYQNFLTKWVDYFRTNGGWSALSRSVGNYNLPYLYFLALFSYSDVSDLYLIKLLSIFFDVILAWGVMRLVYIFSSDRSRVMAAFFMTLLLPTVFLNGSLWGQCDSIYAAFAVWSVYFALSGHPWLSVVSIALSFAFKLQAVFLMPVFLIFIFARRMKWYHLAAFPLTYLVVMLPAVFQGRPFMDCILLYFDQAGTVGSGLNYNSSSIFAFADSSTDAALWSKLGILLAFGFLALLYLYCWLCRNALGDRALLMCALLVSVAVPWLLPHMHDRYFFIADVLSLALAVVLPWLAHVPVCVSFASLLGYHAYLKMRYLMPMRYGAMALGLVVITLIVCLIFEKAKNIKKRC